MLHVENPSGLTRAPIPKEWKTFKPFVTASLTFETTFDLPSPDTGHEIAIGPEGYCISLVAMQGELKLHGLLGRLVQPFLSI